jgi:hypothetical protein
MVKVSRFRVSDLIFNVLRRRFIIWSLELLAEG